MEGGGVLPRRLRTRRPSGDGTPGRAGLLVVLGEALRPGCLVGVVRAPPPTFGEAHDPQFAVVVEGRAEGVVGAEGYRPRAARPLMAAGLASGSTVPSRGVPGQHLAGEVLAADPLAVGAVRPCGVTPPLGVTVWPTSVRTTRPVRASHTLHPAVLVGPSAMRYLPSGLNAKPVAITTPSSPRGRITLWPVPGVVHLHRAVLRRHPRCGCRRGRTRRCAGAPRALGA